MNQITPEIFEDLRKDRDYWRRQAAKWKAEFYDTIRLMKLSEQVNAQRQERARTVEGRW